MNARQLFDDGMTISQVAAETGINRATVAHICEPLAPLWPTLSEELIARLPDYLRKQLEANNPNHRKADK